MKVWQPFLAALLAGATEWLQAVLGRTVTQGADPAFLGGEDVGQYRAADMPPWAQAVRQSGAKLD